MPVVADVVVQTLVVLEQFVQVWALGLFVQLAVSVSCELIAGVKLLGVTVHTGVGVVGGGGVLPMVVCQLTVTPVFGLAPALLCAISA